MIICPYFSSNSRNNPLFLSSFIRYGRDRVGKKGSRRYVSRLYRCKRIVGRRNNAARKGGRGGRTETKGTTRCDSSTPSRIRLSFFFFSPSYLSLLTSSSQPRSLAFKGAILARLISHSFLLGLLEYRIKGYLNRSSVWKKVSFGVVEQKKPGESQLVRALLSRQYLMAVASMMVDSLGSSRNFSRSFVPVFDRGIWIYKSLHTEKSSFLSLHGVQRSNIRRDLFFNPLPRARDRFRNSWPEGGRVTRPEVCVTRPRMHSAYVHTSLPLSIHPSISLYWCIGGNQGAESSWPCVYTRVCARHYPRWINEPLQ